MKRLFTLLVACFAMLSLVRAQVIITGMMYDPAGTDGRVTPDANIGLVFKGGGEYVQLMATENIDFSATPYAVIFNRNPGGTTPDMTNGWVAGGNRTYQFSLTSGTVTKGEFFYVGGLDQYVAGYVKISDTEGYFTADMSGKKWIGAKNYVSNDGDNGVGLATSGILANTGNPTGIGVFNTSNVTKTTVPIDAVFLGGIGAGSKQAVLLDYATNHTKDGTVQDELGTNADGPGYLVPYRNDLYDWNGGAALYLASGKNTNAIAYQAAPFAADFGNFLQLGGVYNTDTKSWMKPRSNKYINMVPSKNNAGATYAADPARVAEIEGTGSTQLVSGISTPAPIVISGFMMDPQGADAPAAGTIEAGTSYTHTGGYEYIQLMATQNIDFSVTPYSFVYCINSGATDGAPVNGWAEPASARTFKFNMTSGTVRRGEFFYVGGPEKTMGGFLVDGTNYYPAGDLSTAKWIRTIAYSTGTNGVAVGDDGIGLSSAGLMSNPDLTGSNFNPMAMAVFAGTAITKNTVPVDAVAIWYNPKISNDHAAVYKGSNYYTVPSNDFFNGGYLSHDGNVFAILPQPTVNVGYFYKLGGVYNTDTQTWQTPRRANYVQLVPPTAFGSVAQRTSFAQLSMLEGNNAGYENIGGIALASTLFPAPALPVQLSSFIAKKQNSAVQLNWKTASEQNNSHFNLLRSVNGSDFSSIAQVRGNGNSNSESSYQYLDNLAQLGVNYYQLEQVDNDGKASKSGIVQVRMDLAKQSLVVSGKNGVVLSFDATSTGQVQIQVSDMQGRVVKIVNRTAQIGQNEANLGLNLNKGIYVLSLTLSGEKMSSKFIVE